MSCNRMCEYITSKRNAPFSPHRQYQCECHNITSSDGFVMQTARILPQKTDSPKGPVFLMHGFLTTGMDWVAQPTTSDSLPYMLSDSGFDVWIGNNRGNIFSVSNTKMDINTEEFWDAVDVDTMAALDVPSIFDYVLAATKAPKLDWVGHSQGGGVMIFALAKNASLKDRLGTAALLAPGVHMAHLKVPLLKWMSKARIDEYWHKSGFDIPTIETHNKYFPGPGFSKVMELFVGDTPLNLCHPTLLKPWASTELCNDLGKIMGISVGHASNLDWRTMADAYRYDPGGASFHLVMHWAQRIRNDTLNEFDWGKNNSQHYNGSTTPPLYDLSKITGTRLALFDGSLDLFITPEDIQSLVAEVPKENWVSHTTFKDYAHFDFVWGKDAHKILYPKVISSLTSERLASEGLVMI